MLTLLPAFPDNVLAVEASGEVTADDYQEVLVPAIESILTDHKRVRLLYVLGEDFDGYSGGAAWEDAKVGMRHFTAFDRVAVVSDTDWVRRMVRGFGFVLPGEVRIYDNDDLDDARKWVSEPPSPGELVFHLDEQQGLLVLEPRDELEAADFDRVAAVVDPWIERNGALAGIAIVAREFPGWDDLAALSAHLGFVRSHHRSVGRVAIVTDSRFLAAMPRLAGLFVHAELKRFTLSERDQALAWAVAAPAGS